MSHNLMLSLGLHSAKIQRVVHDLNDSTLIYVSELVLDMYSSNGTDPTTVTEQILIWMGTDLPYRLLAVYDIQSKMLFRIERKNDNV